MEIKEDLIDHAIKVLNRALESDRRILSMMLLQRWTCSSRLASDETIQVRVETINGNESNTLSPFGLINGLFGVKENGFGYISMIIDDKKMEIIRFERIKE